MADYPDGGRRERVEPIYATRHQGNHIANIKYTSDIDGGQVLDTGVEIGKFCIAGCQIDEFNEKLKALISEYYL